MLMPARTLGARPRAVVRAQYDQARRAVKLSRGWYGLTRWRRRRAAQLKAHPLCVMCKAAGLVVIATVADHVVPHREDADRFWNGKLQSLCAKCHSSDKQREEHRGRGFEVMG